jgi:hypothetical protein
MIIPVTKPVMPIMATAAWVNCLFIRLRDFLDFDELGTMDRLANRQNVLACGPPLGHAEPGYEKFVLCVFQDNFGLGLAELPG